MDNKKLRANNIMWVEYWINQAHPSVEADIQANPYDCYRWICEIELPLINKTVKSISLTEISAMVNAANKASKLIDEYMKSHPELVIKNEFKNGHYEIIGDQDGKFQQLGLTNKARRAISNKYQRQMDKSFAEIEKVIAKLAKINGSSENLFIHVLDQSLFSDDMTISEVLNKINEDIEKRYNLGSHTIKYLKDGNSVVVLGYTKPLKK